MNIDGFDFTNGFTCSDVHNFEKLNNLSINILEIYFYQDKNQWKHYLIPIEISKNESDKVTDLIIYKNHYALIKKLKVCLGDHHKTFICRRCLKSYTSENALRNQKEKCGEDNICAIRTSSKPQIHWNKHSYKNPSYFRISAGFEAGNEIDNSTIGKKTINIYKQNPVLTVCHIKSELNDILQSDYYESLLGYNDVDWFVNEVKKEIRK